MGRGRREPKANRIAVLDHARRGSRYAWILRNVDRQLRSKSFLCDLEPAALPGFESIKGVATYPAHAVLFVEGQNPRGIYVLCRGQVKLSMGSTDGRQFITRIAAPGDAMGLGATVSGRPYELTTETVAPSQIAFVKRDDFLHFLTNHPAACIKVAEHLSEKYHGICREARSLALSESADQKLAQLLWEWCVRDGEANKPEPRLKLAVSHEDISEMIGTARETVTRTLRAFRKRHIVQTNGATLVIRHKAALK